ncbi:MAG: hypothetical protein ACR2QW_15410 [bacterium]
MNTLFNRDRIDPTPLNFGKSGANPNRKKSYLAKWMNVAEGWHQRHKNHYQHLPLEEHLLQDIGKTRMEVELDKEELLYKLESRAKHRVGKDMD